MNKALKELMNVDVTFCEESKTKGSEAWRHYLDEDALMGTGLHEPYITGGKHISKLMEIVYELDNIDFTWTPEYAFISEDETLGVTTGMYTRTYQVEGEEFKEIGKYSTTWKKIKGQWKIIFDMGN